MATTKKKAAGSPEDPPTGAQEMSRIAPFKPRNIAAYEAALEQFEGASALFIKGQFEAAEPLFEAVAVAATSDEPILADRARTYASICAGRRALAPDASTKRGRCSKKRPAESRTTRASSTRARRCAGSRATPKARRRS
jgi:hypothetical protein